MKSPESSGIELDPVKLRGPFGAEQRQVLPPRRQGHRVALYLLKAAQDLEGPHRTASQHDAQAGSRGRGCAEPQAKGLGREAVDFIAEPFPLREAHAKGGLLRQDLDVHAVVAVGSTLVLV